MITPKAEMAAYHALPIACEPNAPSKMANSPTNPFKPGSPIEDRETIRKIAPKIGVIFHNPP